MRRGFYAIPVLVFLGLSAFFLIRLQSGVDPSRIPSVLVGRAAPKLTLPALPMLSSDAAIQNGISADLFTQNKVTILNVWASWCAPCRDEHPYLMQLSNRYHNDERIQIIGLNYKDVPENALRFLKTLGNPFAQIGVDKTGRAGIEWGVYGVPETFIIDAQGIVRHRHVGPLVSTNIAAFEAQLDAVIK